jgi:murein DD-endopeptidase MepM/ murein hydrolase activator NlpD
MSGVGFGLGNGQMLGALGQMPLSGLGFGGLTGQSGLGIGGYRYNSFRDLEVTSEFGERPVGATETEGEVEFHGGTDYAVREGIPLPAIGGGGVTRVDLIGAGALGRNVEYRLDTGELVTYGHLTDAAPIPVVSGQRVGPGQIVGISGSTGASSGPHVHVGIRLNSEPVDPRQYLSLLP